MTYKAIYRWYHIVWLYNLQNSHRFPSLPIIIHFLHIRSKHSFKLRVSQRKAEASFEGACHQPGDLGPRFPHEEVVTWYWRRATLGCTAHTAAAEGKPAVAAYKSLGVAAEGSSLGASVVVAAAVRIAAAVDTAVVVVAVAAEPWAVLHSAVELRCGNIPRVFAGYPEEPRMAAVWTKCRYSWQNQ